MRSGRVLTVGPIIADCLGRPVTEIPPGQGRRILEEIRLTAAGTAAGTAVALAKLGAEVTLAGAVGADTLGDYLKTLLVSHGVDISGVVTDRNHQTSATILPIRPNGDRPALHCPGATRQLRRAEVDPGVLAGVAVVHVGGPDVLEAFTPDELLDLVQSAHEHGATVTMDVLSPCSRDMWETLAPCFEFVDYFLPNDVQLANLTGHSDPADGARAAAAAGCRAVLVSCGEHGALLATDDACLRVPTLATEVVDTTGCGDAVSAGFIIGMLRGWSLELAAWLGMAAAAQVASGLGSDAGLSSLEHTIDLLRRQAPPQIGEQLADLAETDEDSASPAAAAQRQASSLPSYDELPAAELGGRSAWGLFGTEDSVGLVNLQACAAVRDAAALIRTGAVFSLNAPLELFRQPFFGRGAGTAQVWHVDQGIGLDDKLDNFYPQASSHWDSLAHVGYAEGAFYNGATLAQVKAGRNTIDHWAKRGIAGRAVVLDVETLLGGAGRGFDPLSRIEITVDLLDRARRAAGIKWRPGDVALLNTGFLAWYSRQPEREQDRIGTRPAPSFIGIEASENMARYLWDARISALASDNPAVEAWPAQMRPEHATGFLHRVLIGQLGLALGELWWLEDLVEACRHDGCYEAFLTSAPLHHRGGIGSPANALAIK